jgi:tRNA G18 (ribose-2'-O)-methylase SpoU
MSIIPLTQELLSMSEDRNIIDYYHYWTNEQINTHLDTKRHNFSVLISNVHNDFNIGTVIRNCNAFLSKDIFVYGRKKFDRRGCVGTYHYEHIHHVTDLNQLPSNYHIIGIDNIKDAKPIEDHEYPQDKHVLFCFGQEQVGLPQEIIDICHELLYIKQYGSVRSLNVGCANSIVLYDYVKKLSRCETIA